LDKVGREDLISGLVKVAEGAERENGEIEKKRKEELGLDR
jgi:hypothetical protein